MAFSDQCVGGFRPLFYVFALDVLRKLGAAAWDRRGRERLQQQLAPGQDQQLAGVFGECFGGGFQDI